MAIKIRREYCKGCGLCIMSCPKKLLAFEDGFNAKGHHPVFLECTEDCNECGLCYRMCPDFAIFVDDEEECVGAEASEGKSKK